MEAKYTPSLVSYFPKLLKGLPIMHVVKLLFNDYFC